MNSGKNNNHLVWTIWVVAYRNQKTKGYVKSGRGRLRNLNRGRFRESFWSSIWQRNTVVIYKVVAYEKWSLGECWL